MENPFGYAFKAIPWGLRKKGSQKRKRQEASTALFASRSAEGDSRAFASRFNQLTSSAQAESERIEKSASNFLR